MVDETDCSGKFLRYFAGLYILLCLYVIIYESRCYKGKLYCTFKHNTCCVIDILLSKKFPRTGHRQGKGAYSTKANLRKSTKANQHFLSGNSYLHVYTIRKAKNVTSQIGLV